jgi:hypothetical protein
VVAPEVKTRVVLGDLVSDLVAPLLAVALQLLPVLDAAGTIVGQILGPRASRTGSDAGSGRKLGRTGGSAGPGRKLCRCGPAAALQKIGCRAAGPRPGAAACHHSAG